MLSFRIGNFQPFADLNDREDGRYGGIQAGFVTYSEDNNGDETYQQTYVELGGRSDHVADLACAAFNQEREVLKSSAPLDGDAQRLLEKSEPKKADKPEEAAA